MKNPSAVPVNEDFESLSQEDLQRILDQQPVDVLRRVKAQEELDRRKREDEPTWQEKHSRKAIALTALSIAVTLGLGVAGWFIQQGKRAADKSTRSISTGTKPVEPDKPAHSIPSPKAVPKKLNIRTGNTVQGPGSIAQIGIGNTATVNNFQIPPGNDQMLAVQARATSLTDSLVEGLAPAFESRRVWIERGQRDPITFPSRITTWHLTSINADFATKYEADYKPEIAAVSDELMGYVTTVPALFHGPIRDEEGIPVPPDGAEARLYDVCLLLTEMQREHHLPLTCSVNAIREKLHPTNIEPAIKQQPNR